jgi:hypothetical protein
MCSSSLIWRLRAERICLDFAVVNALGPGHWGATAGAEGQAAAAEAYDATKRTRNNTEARCAAEGLVYIPAVFEHQGGAARGADAALRAVAAAVAAREGREPSNLRREMRHRIAVIIARCVAARVLRRQRAHEPQPTWRQAAASAEWLSV